MVKNKIISIILSSVILTAGGLLILIGCSSEQRQQRETKLSSPLTSVDREVQPVSEEIFMKQRQEMVEQQIKARGIKNPRVLAAMLKVPRHQFVPKEYQHFAYYDSPQPIGEGQTISQPYIVALMTELLEPKETDKVLEIGTGSGYQAAILAELVKEVYTIEIIESLARRAEELLKKMGYTNIQVRCADGFKGWPESAPFDGIIVTCAPPEIPPPLIEQLKVGGKLVIPVGEFFQELIVATRTATGIEKKSVIPVRFVPMTGEAMKKK
ncbi:MAG: protein-L-isoaspartate(D-aspartate) O-methyltransferase [Candidatus Sumerlaeia bacterium]|nr:protein-L-isoaspartate(D-aspartate) O-methyltransferase [Candidatus Sumerlaeia bacterium]